jgi:hypothetical protein
MLPRHPRGWTERMKTNVDTCSAHEDQCRHLLAVAALILMYGPFLIAHIHNSASPYIFADDARVWIAPFVVSDYA